MDIEAVKDEILVASLPNVAFDGWCCTSFREGAKSAGYDPETMRSAFPAGVADAVEHYNGWAICRMQERVASLPVPLADMRVRDRIHALVRSYFTALEAHREAQRRLMMWLAMPRNAALGTKLLARTVDAMWQEAGDKATDLSFYTKRILLASVVGATTLYWLDDTSEDHADTWAFVGRRVADIMGVGQAAAYVRDARNLIRAFPDPFRFVRQVRQRSAGHASAGSYEQR